MNSSKRLTNITFPQIEYWRTGEGLIFAKTTITPVSAEDKNVNEASDQTRVGSINSGRKQINGEAIFDKVKAK